MARLPIFLRLPAPGRLPSLTADVSIREGIQEGTAWSGDVRGLIPYLWPESG